MTIKQLQNKEKTKLKNNNRLTVHSGLKIRAH